MPFAAAVQLPEFFIFDQQSLAMVEVLPRDVDADDFVSTIEGADLFDDRVANDDAFDLMTFEVL